MFTKASNISKTKGNRAAKVIFKPVGYRIFFTLPGVNLLSNGLNLAILFFLFANFAICHAIVSGDAPIVSGDAPIVSGDAPIVSGDAPIVSGDAPIVSGDAPIVSGDAPIVSGDAPIVSGDRIGKYSVLKSKIKECAVNFNSLYNSVLTLCNEKVRFYYNLPLPEV